MSKRWTSRKFLVALGAQVAGLVVLFWPEHEQVIVEAVTSTTALLVVVLAALGYIRAEGAVDRERGEDRMTNERRKGG